MKSFFSFIVLFILCSASTAFADSDSTSGSCSGTVSMGYFYAYTYQYAYVASGSIQSESHSFSFSGFLSGMENARVVAADESHLIYRRKDMELAVPFKKDAGLFVRNAQFPSWTKLCSY